MPWFRCCVRGKRTSLFFYTEQLGRHPAAASSLLPAFSPVGQFRRCSGGKKGNGAGGGLGKELHQRSLAAVMLEEVDSESPPACWLCPQACCSKQAVLPQLSLVTPAVFISSPTEKKEGREIPCGCQWRQPLFSGANCPS